MYMSRCRVPHAELGRGSSGSLLSSMRPLWRGALLVAAVSGLGKPTRDLLSQWSRGAGATAMRPLVEAASGLDAALQCSKSTKNWEGLWEGRIEHFELIEWTGLRVRPHYAVDVEGGIISHVHIASAFGGGGGGGWASAAGYISPSGDGTVQLIFDDFWISGDVPSPRGAPSPREASPVDVVTRLLGRAAFFPGLAKFPIDYADLDEGLVAFRFTPFNSLIVSRRAPTGDSPLRVGA